MAIELTEQQRLAVTLRGSPLLVSAAAGSGKTRVLVDRITDAVSGEKKHIDDYLVITYTRAAAGELRSRIGKALSEAGASSELLRLHRAQIGTIHSFCGALIRRFAVECGVRPNFRQLESGEADDLRVRALEDTLETLYAGQPEGSPFDLLADTMSDTGRDRRLGEIIVDLYDSLQAMPDPGGWMDGQLEIMRAARSLPPEQTPWGAFLLEDAGRELGFIRELMERARAAMDAGGALAGAAEAYGPAFDDDLDTLDGLVYACGLGWTALSEALSVIVHTKLGRLFGKTPEAERLLDVRDRYKKTVKRLEARFSSAEDGHGFESALPLAEGLFLAVRTFSEIYGELKAGRNALDFSDLEHKARELLCKSERGGTAFGQWDEVLVDEYQDVNQVQEDIINALTEDGGNVFLVGDVRQSVYGFRQADPDIFLRKYSDWPEADAANPTPDGPRCVILPHNFRSHPMLLEAVNHIFGSIMSKESAGLDYGGRERLKPPPGTANRDTTPRAAFYMCGSGGEDDGQVDGHKLEADAVAELIARAAGLEEGVPALTVMSGGTVRPARPGDIAVLVRTRSDIPYYRRALSERGIPCSAQESRLFDALELRVALACFQVLDNPRQDIPLLTLLRSPLYGCSPDELAEIRMCCQDGRDMYDAVCAAADAGCEKALRLTDDMAYLRSLAADASPDRVYHAMLERPGLLTRFGELPGGRARRRNLLSIVPAVARCGTVTECRELLERMERSGEPGTCAAGGDDGVALMTMHKSKGLEFPVVIVPGLSRRFNMADARKPVLFHKRMGLGFKHTDPETRIQYATTAREAVALRLGRDTISEEMRLLYVALTRAKDYLFASAWSADWDRVSEAMTPATPGGPHPYQVMNARCMADWMLMALSGTGGDYGSWRVVRHTRSGAAHGVTEPQLGRTAAPDGVPTPRVSDAARYPYAASVELPSKMTATELKGRLRDLEMSEEAHRYTPKLYKGRELPRPRFLDGGTEMTPAQRGTALHAAMQQVVLERCVTVEGAASELSRLISERRMSEAQAASVSPALITGFVNSPLGRRVAASPDVRRELPFSLLTKAGVLLPGSVPGAAGQDSILLQGMIDLLFREGDGWILLDFKTDRLRGRDPRTAAEDYRPQLDIYASAVTRMTGLPVLQKLIYFMDGGIEVAL